MTFKLRIYLRDPLDGRVTAHTQTYEVGLGKCRRLVALEILNQEKRVPLCGWISEVASSVPSTFHSNADAHSCSTVSPGISGFGSGRAYNKWESLS